MFETNILLLIGGQLVYEPYLSAQECNRHSLRGASLWAPPVSHILQHRMVESKRSLGRGSNEMLFRGPLANRLKLARPLSNAAILFPPAVKGQSGRHARTKAAETSLRWSTL